MGKGKRYILDRNNGYNVMANLYIIRYLYQHLEKSEKFLEENSQRKKSKDFYKEFLHMNRQRVQRIYKGECFELSADKRKDLYQMFNIDEEYFLRNGKVMNIHLLDDLKWKKFFEDRYIGEKGRVNEEITEALERLCVPDAIPKEYETSTPIYRVYYLLKYGTKYEETSQMIKFLKELSNLKLSDWEELEDDVKQLEGCLEQLKKHYDYVKTVVDYKKIKYQL